jgi:hypothetical protein
VFPGLQFSNHGRHAMARAALPGWSWPTLADGMRRVFRTTFIVLGLGGAIAGCAPPPFKLNISYEKKPENNYFDRLLTGANPSEANSISDTYRDLIVSRRENNNQTLIKIISDSSGSCNKVNMFYNCKIQRKYSTNSCNSTECYNYSRSWIIIIRWNSLETNFVPNVKSTISYPVPIRNN